MLTGVEHLYERLSGIETLLDASVHDPCDTTHNYLTSENAFQFTWLQPTPFGQTIQLVETNFLYRKHQFPSIKTNPAGVGFRF